MLIDSHIHYYYPGNPKQTKEVLDLTKAHTCCFQSCVSTSNINQNIEVLYAKSVCNEEIYINAALDSSLYLNQDQMNEMPKYIERMMKCGFDGIKLLEGKPTCRKRFPIPNFDDPKYESTFKYLEEHQIPLTWHVNDPEEFWDNDLVPDWARRSGWFYGDGTYVNNIDQYNQIENMLNKHPNLNVCFAHFYFLSNNLTKLSEMFDKYPNMYIDITPGVELFENLSKNINKSKEFFNKYASRIIYGTDICIYKGKTNDYDKEDSITRKKLCHEFLSKDQVFIKGDKDSLLGENDLNLNGLSLTNEQVELIESGNFLRRYKGIKKLNNELILKEIDIHNQKLIELNKDNSYLKEIKEYFINKNH